MYLIASGSRLLNKKANCAKTLFFIIGNVLHRSSQYGEERAFIMEISPKDKDIILAVAEIEVTLQVIPYFLSRLHPRFLSVS